VAYALGDLKNRIYIRERKYIMRIIFNEIKKIFNFKMVIMIMFISFIMYYLFLSNNPIFGLGGEYYYKTNVQMIKDYGNSMDKEEFINFKQVYNNRIEDANKYLQSKPELVSAEIASYEKFNDMSTIITDDKLMKLRDKVFADNADIFFELETRESIVTDYERIEGSVGRNVANLNKIQLERYSEVVGNGFITSILPYYVFENYCRTIKDEFILIVFSIIFMISPIFIKDSTNKVNYLQYTSKTGRKIFKSKIFAALISSFIIISINLICFFMFYSRYKVGMFLSSSINSIFNLWYLSWFNISFIQYIALTVLAIYVLGFVITLIVTFISRIAPNYMTLIGVLVPITFIGIFISNNFLLNRLTVVSVPKYFLLIAYSILVLIGLMLIVIRWKKEKVVDIIN
jgi:hypothetical protein